MCYTVTINELTGVSTMETIRKCAYCGKPAHSTRNDVKYCSASCRTLAWKQRWKIRRHQRVCAACGVHFVSQRSDALYCSRACKQRAWRDQHALAENT